MGVQIVTICVLEMCQEAAMGDPIVCRKLQTVCYIAMGENNLTPRTQKEARGENLS